MKAFFAEFKKFIARGNVMDMAVGVIIGGAFTAIVTSLVDDVMMPLLSLITGGLDFSSLCIVLGEGEMAATLNYGSFIAAVINFLLIAFVIFLLIKGLNKLSRSAARFAQPEEEKRSRTGAGSDKDLPLLQGDHSDRGQQVSSLYIKAGGKPVRKVMLMPARSMAWK